MADRTEKEAGIEHKPSGPPIHSKGDVHDTEEGMPLTLGGGGYGGTSQTTSPEDAKNTSDRAS